MLDWDEFLDAMKMLASFTIVMVAYAACGLAVVGVVCGLMQLFTWAVQ